MIERVYPIEDAARAHEETLQAIRARYVASLADLGPALDLVQTQRVRAVLDEIQRHYAFVVLDGAPLVDSPESSFLAAATDGVVLVVRANRTRREVVQRGLRLLHQSNCQVLGAVLNERKYPIPSFLYRRL